MRGLRSALAAFATLAAGLASLATSAPYCPRAVSLSDSADVEPSTSLSRQYRVDASSTPKLHILVSGTSAGAADVRIRLEPDDPSRFPDPWPPTDAGLAPPVELALRPGTRTTAEIELPRCKGSCPVFGFSVTVEHVSGAAATLTWDVVLETEGCEDNYHATIERQ